MVAVILIIHEELCWPVGVTMNKYIQRWFESCYSRFLVLKKMKNDVLALLHVDMGSSILFLPEEM